MVAICFIVVSIYLLSFQECLAHPRAGRMKREEVDDLLNNEEKLLTESETSLIMPAGHKPMVHLNPHHLAAPFPFVHVFNTELVYDDGLGFGLAGFLEIPKPEWKQIWDLKGKFQIGGQDLYVNYGHLVNPNKETRKYESALKHVLADPHFKKHYLANEAMPVANLPNEYQPLWCNPPLCNPFVHNVAASVDVYQPSDFRMYGMIDFPLAPRDSSGAQERFPLRGGLATGAESVGVSYGHALSPFDPFKPSRRELKLFDSLTSDLLDRSTGRI